MKKKNWMIAILVATLAPSLVTASETATANKNDGFSVLLGYSYLTGGPKYAHDTHPADAWMQNGTVPGSAGETGAEDLHFLQVGARYEFEVFKGMTVNFDGLALLGANENKHQNANDTRPAGEGSFVYSNAPYGAMFGTGVNYYFGGGLYVGLGAQMNFVYFEHGWDRWGSQQAAKTENEWFATVCPRIGWQFGGDMKMSIELAGQMGQDFKGFSVGAGWKF